MKLKELPVSLFKTLKLISIPAKQIKNPSGKVLPVIVSLTSIPSRLHIIHITLRSILSQKEVPQKIVLWLNESLKNEIPKNLKTIEGPFFEIRYSTYNCSHRKLVHSLELFPKAIIITCDDDCIYRPNWLKSLYNTHLKYPQDIIAHRLRCIRYDENNNLLPYKQWKLDAAQSGNTSALLPIGSEGVLYPPHSLLKQATDAELYLKLTPKADDLWFKAMSFLNETQCRKSEHAPELSIPIIGTQAVSLKKTNVNQDLNRDQWLSLVNYYNLPVLK